jgi:hypothetical protein
MAIRCGLNVLRCTLYDLICAFRVIKSHAEVSASLFGKSKSFGCARLDSSDVRGQGYGTAQVYTNKYHY